MLIILLSFAPLFNRIFTSVVLACFNYELIISVFYYHINSVYLFMFFVSLWRSVAISACFNLFNTVFLCHRFKYWQSLWVSVIGRYAFWLVACVPLQPIRCRPRRRGAWSMYMQMTVTLRRVASYHTALWHRLNSVFMDTEMPSNSSCQCQVSVKL